MNNKQYATKSLTNKEPFTPAIYIYIFGLILALILYYYLLTINKKQKYILLIIMIYIVIIFTLNSYFSYKHSLGKYNEELNAYSYVELNGRVLVASSLGIALFFRYKHVDEMSVSSSLLKSVEYPIIMAFICSALILTIVWMPTHNSKYIRILRDIKTIFLTLSISFLITTMITSALYFSG